MRLYYYKYTMQYYKVFVSDNSFKGSEPLTYSSASILSVGSIVQVPLKNKLVIGFICELTKPPQFKTKLIERVFSLPELPVTSIRLVRWLQLYYPSPTGLVTQQFLPKRLWDTQQYYDNSDVKAVETKNEQPLTIEQKNVIKHITDETTYVLHGETGSGKTRVYIELAKRALDEHKSAIILTPEISLTPQLTGTFKQTFGNQRVVITHSQLTDKERSVVWVQILKSTTPMIVIGPRSALFSPLRDVGLIVVDEAHEPSYKQDQSPHYQTVRVASKLAQLHHALLVLGSATPAIVDYFMAQQKTKPILRMEKLAKTGQIGTPTITVVDIKDHKQFERSRHLSDQLINSIAKALENREQSLLFLNRRGTARSILCENCGWQAMCPDCNLPLTYHGDNYALRCHTCGYNVSAFAACPVCKSPDIVLRSVGTKAIVDEISAIFPQARVRRFDADNKKAERFEQHYESVKAGKEDIIVGTQILAKGLDLPKLSTVGIVIADTSLYFPDYTAQERTYQLLRQVIGRVGRGHRESSVVVQTFNPKNFVIKDAVTNNWSEFYKKELQQRKLYMFPPFCFMLKLSCRRATPAGAKKAAEKLMKTINSEKLHIQIDGPMPSFYERISNKYQWQLVVKAKQRGELIKVIDLLPNNWSYDIDPLNLL